MYSKHFCGLGESFTAVDPNADSGKEASKNLSCAATTLLAPVSATSLNAGYIRRDPTSGPKRCLAAFFFLYRGDSLKVRGVKKPATNWRNRRQDPLRSPSGFDFKCFSVLFLPSFCVRSVQTPSLLDNSLGRLLLHRAGFTASSTHAGSVPEQGQGRARFAPGLCTVANRLKATSEVELRKITP